MNKQKIILYGHPACPMLPPVWGTLKSAKVNFEYIDIHQNEDGREHVRSINKGYESVPTLVFPDGSTLTEPSPRQLIHKLRQMGYPIPLLAWLTSYSFYILMLGLLLVVVLNLI